MSNSISLSICVPAFNEEGSIKEAVDDLLQTLSPYFQQLEIIIVNDGSTDNTRCIAEQLALKSPQIKIIHHRAKLGVGVSYRDALAVAKGDYFTWFPADHENSAEEFVQCLPYLREDAIVTCYHTGQDYRTLVRRWLSRSFTWILNKLFNLDLKYYNGLTIFPISVLRCVPLKANGFIFTAESVIRAVQQHCKVIELLFPLRNRFSGKSKALTLKSFFQILRDILRFN